MIIDAQARLIQGIAPALGSVPVTGRVPDDLTSPAVVVAQGRAGKFDGITSTAYLDVKCYHPSRDGAVALSRQARAAMLNQAHTAASEAGDQLVDVVAVETEPVEMFYSPDVTLYVATYRIASRDQ